jgi:transcriptional regulator with XRE-family HTH domain
MAVAGEDWRRLGDYVRNRRKELNLSRAQFASMTDVSYRTAGQVERGIPVARDTVAAMENALGWKPGSGRRILDGGDPILTGDTRDEDAAATDAALRQLTEKFAELTPAEQRGLVALAEAMAEKQQQRRTGT